LEACTIHLLLTDQCQNLTPVPGAVGPLQMATLLERLVKVTTGREIEKWTYQELGSQTLF